MEKPLDYSYVEKAPIFGFFKMVLTWLENIFAIKIPIGDYCETLFNWLKDSFSSALDFFSSTTDALLQWTLHFLLTPPLILLFIMVFVWVLEKNWPYRLLLLTGLIAMSILDSFLPQNYSFFTIASFCLIFIFYILTSNDALKKWLRFLISLIIIAFAILAKTIDMGFWPPELTLILLFALFSWFMQERLNIVMLVILSLLFILNQGYWQDTMETLSIVFWSCFI